MRFYSFVGYRKKHDPPDRSRKLLVPVIFFILLPLALFANRRDPGFHDRIRGSGDLLKKCGLILDLNTDQLYQKGQKLLEGDDPETVATGYLLQGAALYYKGDYKKSINKTLEGADISRKEGFDKGVLISQIYLGRVYRVREHYERSLEHLYKAQENCRKSGDKRCLPTVLIDLIEFYRASNKFEKALELIKEFESVNMEFQLPSRIQARFYHRQAAVLNQMGRTDDAKTFSLQSLSLSRRIGHKTHMATSFNELASIWIQKGDREKAMEYLQKAKDIWIKANHERSLANLTIKEARINYQQGKVQKALDLGYKCLKRAEAHNWTGILNITHHFLGNIHNDLGNYKKAVTHLKKGHGYALAKVKGSFSTRMAELESKYHDEVQKRELADKRKELQMMRKENQLRTMQRNLYLGGVGVLVIAIAFLFYWFRQTKKLNNTLREQKDEIQKANKELASTIEQKEALLKEVHHRVKNNLTVLSSLFNLQEKNLNDQNAIEVLKESKHRVLSIAKVHQNLYQMDNAAEIDCQSFIHEMLNDLAATFPNGDEVEKKVDCEDLSLTVNQAVPIALILNELLSNAFKYACREKGSLVGVRTMKNENGEIVLQVYDNGPGLEGGIEGTMDSNTLGLTLVKVLTEQLDGEFSYERDRYSNFYVKFPISND